MAAVWSVTEVEGQARGRGVGSRVRGVCRLPQSVVFGLQLAQVISGEVSSPRSLAVQQGLLPQLLHLDRTHRASLTQFYSLRTKNGGRDRYPQISRRVVSLLRQQLKAEMTKKDAKKNPKTADLKKLVRHV